MVRPEPAANWSPVTSSPSAAAPGPGETRTNEYDWGSPADRLVEDPLSPNFHNLWTGTARNNTEVFSDVFHNVPNDKVRNWDQYQSFFSSYFIMPGAKEDDEDSKDKNSQTAKVDYGHVVPGYPGGVRAVKQRLATVRGNLVEMPLQFLVEVKDLAKEGLSLNEFTDELYT